MAALERLTVEQVRSGDLLSAHHVHRYAWAAELCAGLRAVDLACGEGYGSDILHGRGADVLGVDRDPAAVGAARKHFPGPGVRFEQHDAGSFVRRPLHEEHDVLVCFEGLEHFDDLDAVLDQLRYLSGVGLRLVLSLPNEDKFVEDNHFHVQTFSYREVRALAATFAGAVVVQQFLAEGSVIAAADGEPPVSAAAAVVNRERFEAEYANHWIIAVGFEPEAVRAASSALAVATSPNYNSYMTALERANAELLRINNELRQERMGRRDAAAAVGARDGGDLQTRYEALVQQLAAPRYRIVDGVRARALAVPGASTAWWRLRQAAGRARQARRAPVRRS